MGHTYKYVSGSATSLRAVRWDAGGTDATELGGLGTPAGFVSYAYVLAVNDAGTAVGQADKYVNGSWGRPPVRWDAGGTAATELGGLGTDANGITNGCARSINGSGTAVGQVEKYVGGVSDGYRAVRWDAAGTPATELGALGMGTHCEAISINAAGTAAGHAEKCVDGVHVGDRAVRWDAGGTGATELGDLGTSADGYTWTFAYAMNDAGTVVGFANKYVSGNCIGERAVRWDAGGTPATELDDLGADSNGWTNSRAYSVSDAGTAVGYARKYVSGMDMGDRAVLWGLDGAAIDLNTVIDPDSGWCLTNAYAISGNGRYIAGAGYYDPDGSAPQTSYQRLYTMDLSTIPEPAPLFLVPLGALALLACKRK